MLVTKVEPVTKTKYRVELDQQFAFVLYKGELARNLAFGKWKKYRKNSTRRFGLK